jgi:AraC-like DNA-binding protein
MAVDGESPPGAIPGAAQAFRFSTDDFREHERVAAWREVFGRTVLNIDIAPRSQDTFSAEAKVFRSATLGVIRATTSPVTQSNSRSLITSDDVSFGCVLTSRWGASQLGRNTDLGPGDAVLMSNGDVGALTFPEDCRYVAFGLSKAALEPLVPDLGALFARRIPASNPALRMLLQYLVLGHENHVAADPALQAAFTSHVCDLLAIALGATRDAAEAARTRGGLPAARLRAMKDDIRKSCHRADLTVHAVAARHGVSVRYVQRVFEESGTTFTQYVAGQRLAAAYKALRRPGSGDVPVSTIAYDCGFSDVSHFNRLFRQRFGCTPSDLRNSAMTHDGGFSDLLPRSEDR